MSVVIDDKTRAHQAVRMRRLWMTVGSYCFTLMVVITSAVQGFVGYTQIASFIVLAGLVNGIFYIALRTNWNLSRRDPNMTGEQMVLSLIPALWVMYYADDSQVRTAFLLIALVPLLYGILGLDTRRFLWVGLQSFILYAGLSLLLLYKRPEVINLQSEIIALAALLAVLAQIALLGGYINQLREKLRGKNEELNQAMAKISQMANQDELTGVNNRRSLLHVLEQEYNRCQRGAEPFSLCIMDIDYFKHINDRYGHLAGDEVLKRVAHLIKENVRKIDCFGRYGGEEFLLILPQTPVEGALLKAERIREMIAAAPFDEYAADFRVTLSMGVAQFHAEESLRETIARADAALYNAKESGRNRVMSAETKSEA